MGEEKHDELSRQGITRDEYKQLNTMLTESLDEEMHLEPPDSEEDEFNKMNKTTTNDVIECDTKELMEL